IRPAWSDLRRIALGDKSSSPVKWIPKSALFGPHVERMGSLAFVVARPLSRRLRDPNLHFRTRHTRLAASKCQPPVAFWPSKKMRGWLRAWIPSNSMASLYGIAQDGIGTALRACGVLGGRVAPRG